MQNAGASRREPKTTVNHIVACYLIARCTYAKFMCVRLSEPKNHIVSVFSALTTLIGKNIILDHIIWTYRFVYAHSQVHLSVVPYKFKSTSCSIQLYNLQSADFIPCLVSTLQLT